MLPGRDSSEDDTRSRNNAPLTLPEQIQHLRTPSFYLMYPRTQFGRCRIDKEFRRSRKPAWLFSSSSGVARKSYISMPGLDRPCLLDRFLAITRESQGSEGCLTNRVFMRNAFSAVF